MGRNDIPTATYLPTFPHMFSPHKAFQRSLLVQESFTVSGSSASLSRTELSAPNLLASSRHRCRSGKQRAVSPLMHDSLVRKHSPGVNRPDVESRSRWCRHQRPRSTIPCSPRVPLAKARPDGPTPRGDQSPLHCWMCSEAILGQLCVARRLSEVCIGASRGRTCRSPFP